MPGNEVENGTRNLFELDYSCGGQLQSQAVDDNLPVLNYNNWFGKLRQVGGPLDSNLYSYSVQQLGSVGGHSGDSLTVPFDQNIQLSSGPEYSRSYLKVHQSKTNGSLRGDQNLQSNQYQPELFRANSQHDLTLRGYSVLRSQEENEAGDSPTVTTNSERSEITEASSDFDFLRGQRQLLTSPQSGIIQACPMQQPGYSDMQLLQQHMIFKQLQELQRKQQLQQFGDMRLQSPLNQYSVINKQGAMSQFPPLINGTPVHDTSQMFLNWGQRGASSTAQGTSNRFMISQDQGQARRSMGVAPQELDVSLYGTPLATTRGNMSELSHYQGISNDPFNLSIKTSGQAQKPMTQLSGFSNPYLRDQCAVSSEQACMPQGSFVSKQAFQANNFVGQVPFQGLSAGDFAGNPQEGATPKMNAPAKEFNCGQEPALWPAMQQKTQLGSSPGLVPLDPMEEKILYNMDENVWENSFGRHQDLASSGFSNVVESEMLNTFPSVQSGSWSALMQSAVAEASSSDTGVQEEWSGLTFQNMDQSTDNQHSSFMDSERQQTGWVDNNLQSASSKSKLNPVFNDSGMSSMFPGFQQPGSQYSTEQREGLHNSTEKSSTVIGGKWIGYNPQEKPSLEESRQVHSRVHLDNAWAGQVYEHSHSDAHRQRMASNNDVSQPCIELKGNVDDAAHEGRDPDGSFSRSSGGVQQVKSGTDNTLLNGEDSLGNNFGTVPYARTNQVHQSTRHVRDGKRCEQMEHVGISLEYNENVGPRKTQHQLSDGPLTSGQENRADIYERPHNTHQRENTSDSYNSKNSGHELGNFSQFKFFGNVSSSSMNLDKGPLPGHQETFKVSEEVPSRGDHGLMGDEGSNIAVQTSENMLELLHKVDKSGEDGTMPHFGSTELNSSAKGPETGISASVPQMYNQHSALQGFGLRLAPPTPTLPNSNCLSSQGSSQMVSHLGPGPVNSELREKNQTWVAHLSGQSLHIPHDLSQRAHWDNESLTSGQTGISLDLKVHENSVMEFTSTSYLKNQPQVPFMSSLSVASQNSQATLPGTTGKFSPLNVGVSQENSQRICNNLFGQQSPVLEPVPVCESSVTPGMPGHSDRTARPLNVWTNVPTHRHSSGPQLLKVSSTLVSAVGSPNNSLLNLPKTGHESPKFGAYSMNSPGLEHGKEQPGKDRLQQQISSDSHAQATFQRNLASAGSSLKSSHSLHQTSSEQHQVQAMQTVETDPSNGFLKTSSGPDKVADIQPIKTSVGGQQLYEHNSVSRNPMDGGLNTVSQLNSFAHQAKTLSFLTEARKDLNAKALSHHAFQDISSQGMVKFNQSGCQSQLGSSNALINHSERGQFDLHMAPSWFNQYRSPGIGQMVPMYASRLEKSSADLFSLGKPSQNLHIQASVDQSAADASAFTSVKPNTTSTMVPNDHSHFLPSDITPQNLSILRPKKRKSITAELLPWHKIVAQGFQRPQHISVAEQEWAQATNRLIDKVGDEIPLIEDVHPHRSKRRLILTSQLMQQLLRPAPASVLSVYASSFYDVVSYFVSNHTLGDACCLTYQSSKNSPLLLAHGNMISKTLENFGKVGDQPIAEEVVEGLISRAKKLENDFHRLDKAATIADIRMECQESEKLSVINRFAKFHVRGPADTSGNASCSGGPRPVACIIGLPMPRNLPEGVQCLSL